MVKKNNVHHNLDELESLFNQTSKQSLLIFYSKLSLLELCGWIEETMDGIIKAYTTKYISHPKNIKWSDDVVKYTYSFEYDKFKKMVVTLVGLRKTEIIESRLDASGDLPILKSTLGNLKTKRDSFAHTFTKRGTTTTLYGPSSVKGDFTRLYKTLRQYEIQLMKMK